MNEQKLELYWNDIPEGHENAVTYERLCTLWGMSRRGVRHMLHELSKMDNGDDYILIRSSGKAGFYKTTDVREIRRFREECLKKGRHIFAPIKKIDRVLNIDSQLSLMNNLRAFRLAQGIKQSDVCEMMKCVDPSFDVSMLSKMESGRCLPTPIQLAQLAYIYGCTPHELVDIDLYT